MEKKNETSNFWIAKISESLVYFVVLFLIYKYSSIENSYLLIGLSTSIFVWIMNITFAKDYQHKNDIKLEEFKIKNNEDLENYKTIKSKELRSYQKNIDKSLKDYQSENDRKLEEFKALQTKELETHKSKLSGYTLVTKLQFELEFNAYREIYAQLINICEEMDKLNKSLNLENGKTNKYIESLENKKKKLNSNILKNSPFINIFVLDDFKKNSKFLNNYLSAINSKNISSISRQGQIFKMYIDEISFLIKERIASMRIIED